MSTNFGMTLMKWVVRVALVFCCVACGAGQPTSLPTLTPVPTPVPDGLFVDAAQELGSISPYVYGSCYGPWVCVPPDLLPQAEASGVTYLRFPGGEWGDQNNLRDYHIDRFIAFARRIGAEPKINVRMPGGSPEQAAELVRYCNVTNDYDVRYWGIGNEPNLYTSYTMYGDYDTVRYNKEWREFAEAMLAVDPDIVLIGPGTSQYTGNPETDPRDEEGRDWVREFLLANGDLVDIVAIHRYPFPINMTDPSPTIDELRANSREWDTIIPNLRALIRETTGRDLPVAVNEINSNWTHATGGEATPDSFYNAIWWGDVLGRLIRQKVDIVAYFLLQCQTSQGGYGLLARFEVRPTYYVYQMYQYFGDDLLYASSDDPDVSIYAARRQDSALTLILVNLGPEEEHKPLRLESVTPTGPAEIWLFDVDHQAEQIGAQTIADGTEITLPPQSISLYIIPYSSTDAPPAPTASPTTAPETPLYQDPTAPIDNRVADLLSRMSLDEKIGQMTQAEREALHDIQNIAAYHLGSLLSGGGSTPSPNTPEAWADMYDSYQEQALSTRLGIPLIYGADAVHGHNNVKGAVIFPHNLGLGATRNPELIEEIGRITALEVAGTGVDWTFSPCLAVFRDERWGRTYESFGETPELVSLLGGAIVRGYQGADLGSGETILATAKHWVGDGGTTGGVDRADAEIDEQTLRSIHVAPYVEAINAGVGSVMVSQSSWNGTEMHANGYLIDDVLKGELGFEGFVVSDWEAIDQIPGDYRSDVRTAINAGLDMIMVPYEYVTFIDTLRDAVESGDVPMERIDDAVGRILRAKFQLGLFENPYTDRDLTDLIGSAEHRETARQAVRESLVLLKNEDALLPLSKDFGHIHVAGRNADDLGSQCGGWTITWQGRNGNITAGTTILEAIEHTVSENTTVTFSRNGSDAEGADVGIVVVGETPYAEWVGDKNDLGLARADVNAINAVREAGVPVVVILVSGRPMIVEPELENWDALIAAWLPGTEGQGVADVLFGDYDPTGKLPCSWPRTMEQVPINWGDADYDPLFAYGFGLEYE